MININPKRSWISLELLRTRPSDVKDPEKRVGLVKNSMKYYNQNISWMRVENPDDINYAIPIVKQVYQRYIESKS